MAGKKKQRPPTPLERAIRSRERGIARMRTEIKNVRLRAAEEIRGITLRIKEKTVLLDALKSGKLRK